MGNPAQFTVRTHSRHPDLDEAYDDANHRYREEYLDPTYILELDAFPGSEVVDVIVVQGPRGKPHEIEIERLDLPDDASAYEWRVEQRDGRFFERIVTPIRHSTVSGSTGVFGTPYRESVEVPRPGIYDIDLQLRLESGGGPTHSEVFELRDYLVVSIGDSYASGEGNPDRPGEPKGFEVEAEWWEVVVVPIVAFKLTKAAFEWGRDLLTREFTTFAQGLNADIEMDPVPRWLEEEAHRSLRAGPAVAAGLLEDVREGDLVTFVSFARSGAEIQDGLFGPRTSDGKSIDSWIGNVGELSELRRLISRIERPVDALVMSIGGNDTGFSGRLSDLVAEDNPLLSLSLGKDDSARETAKQQVDAALEKLEGTRSDPGEYDRLAEAIESLDVEQVYITEYPTSHFERTDHGRVHVDSGCGIFTSYFDADIDKHDAQLMKESAERLNSVIRGKAREHGWVYVNGIADEFRGRGYCMGDDSYFVSAEGSLVKQGDTKGTMHPNAIGQRVYGESIASALETHMIEGKPIASGDDGLSLRDAATRMNDHDDGRIDVRNLLERVSSEPPNSVRSLLLIK